MEELYYIGLDLHKKIIAYCIKTASGVIVGRGTVAATRSALLKWIESLPKPWVAAMEATLFTGWVYDFLKPHAKEVVVAYPAMLHAYQTCPVHNQPNRQKKGRHSANPRI